MANTQTYTNTHTPTPIKSAYRTINVLHTVYTTLIQLRQYCNYTFSVTQQ